MIQPPRGFGENPVAIYHDPDLPPSHHYLAAYRWLEEEFGAHAVVHLGKHGSLEWLPGKTAGLSAACAPDAAIGNLPLIYPFLINDPGEGAQAKRRAHATIVDHLIPPMARAESYGDIARLEQLLDEHANIAAMDPAKLPAVRAQIWTLIHAAKMDHDLGLDERPDDEEFDDFLLHVDGWLCEIKDAQIRDGLHVLGGRRSARRGSTWCWRCCGPARCGAACNARCPGLRAALGLKDARRCRRGRGRGAAHDLVAERWRCADWAATAVVVAGLAGRPEVAGACSHSPPPRWCRGSRAPPPSSTRSCTRWTAVSSRPGRRVTAARAGQRASDRPQLLHRRPARPCRRRLAWETGQAMADSLVERYRDDTGD